MRALVIGADGFVGRWLVRHLHESGDHVTAVVGSRFLPPLDGADAILQADVREYASLAPEVAEAAPDALYYLAAVSQAGGRENVVDAARIGLVGAIHAMASSATGERRVRFLHVSSAHVYGFGGSSPLAESAPLRPASVYGAAKAASEQALLFLGPAAGMDVVVARAFNHIGPGQASTFLVPSLVAQVKSVLRAGQRTIKVGRPEMVRDYTDVRDVVRAYRMLVTKGDAGGVYNVASGVGVSVAELVSEMADIAGAEVSLSVDPRLAATEDAPTLIGSAVRLRSLGWNPTYPLRQTLSEIIDWEPPGTS